MRAPRTPRIRMTSNPPPMMQEPTRNEGPVPSRPGYSFTFTQPDDWHLHVRDGDVLAGVVPHTAAQFARAIIMPNLRPPVTTTAQALNYQQRIQAAVPPGMAFDPLMTLYLTDQMSADEIRRARDAGVIAVKLYPAGATTNSDAGVTHLRKTYATLEVMQREGVPLLVHGEVTSSAIDVFDREAVFIETQLMPLRHDFPELKIVMEHITTSEAVQYVQASNRFTAATLTAHHLLFNRNALFNGGIRPHYFCWPVLKREVHRQALLVAATGGSPKFFLGTDSAPHAMHLKESNTGCAGCYTAHAAMALYAQAFDAVGALDKLEAFASFHGADFYGLPRNTGTLTLRRDNWTVPESFQFGPDKLQPLCSGETLAWRVVS